MREDQLFAKDLIAYQIEQILRAIAQVKEFTSDDVALAAAQLCQMEMREEVSIDETAYQARLDGRLIEAGLSFEQRLRAQYMLEEILISVRRLKAGNAPQRGDDPACCDPGGGMRSLHEIEEDEQF